MYFSLTVTAVLKGSSTCIAAHLLLYWKAKKKRRKKGGWRGGGGGGGKCTGTLPTNSSVNAPCRNHTAIDVN